MTGTNSSSRDAISCLMVTQDPVRLDLLQKSVHCYLDQDYPNRELVICCDGPLSYRRQLRRFIDSLQRPDIRLPDTPSLRTLGEMRNYSARCADGDYLCQWDDDDLNHPSRLQTQLAHLKSMDAPVSYFQDQLHYFSQSNELYWVNWYPDHIPGTLMCRTTVMATHAYPALGRDEDGQLRDTLRSTVEVAGLRDMGYLNVYAC